MLKSVVALSDFLKNIERYISQATIQINTAWNIDGYLHKLILK